MISKKRADVGIGTLIVFIAMILVAAVAAGVIIRTSGILQERAFAVGGEARKRLITGLEVMQVIGSSNLSTSTIPKLEIYVRTRPGSMPLQFKTTGFTYSTQNVALSAELQHSSTELFNYNMTGNINSTEWITLPFDMNRDYLDDYVRLANTTGDIMVLQFNISDVYDYINVSLGVNFTGTTERNISLSESAIAYDDSIYGFVDLAGNLTSSENFNASRMNIFRIRQFPRINVCSFERLVPERFFCIESRLGDTDTVLESGELYIVRYKLRPADELHEEETFQVNFMPKDGSVTFLEAAPPSVIGDKKVVLWPS